MDSYFTNYVRKASIGEDVFGEEFAGREKVYDPQNKDLFLKMLKNYKDWSLKTGNCSPTLENDIAWIQRYNLMKWAFFGLGAVFALTVVNPNFVKRRSWYLRKINVVVFGTIGYTYIQRYQED